MADSDPIAFTRQSAERIANAVRAVEVGSRKGGGIEWDTQLPQNVFRLKLATFSGAWATGTFKTVTLSGSTQTASVYNWCNPVEGSTANTAQKHVIFGNVRGTASAIELPFTTPVRIGKTEGSWSKGTLATIPLWEDGTPPSETVSGVSLADCVNKFANVAAGKWVALGLGANGRYYLIAAECS